MCMGLFMSISIKILIQCRSESRDRRLGGFVLCFVVLELERQAEAVLRLRSMRNEQRRPRSVALSMRCEQSLIWSAMPA